MCDAEFINYIQNYDIVLLGETWLNKNTIINCDIQGFECEHLFARKSLGTRKGRYSGGISIYFKSSLKNYIKIVEKSPYGLIWLKIDSKILKSDSDLFICYCYLRDKNSRVLRHEDVDLYEILENGISNTRMKAGSS